MAGFVCSTGLIPGCSAQSGWRGLLAGFGGGEGGAQVVGRWQGGKTANDPVRGGYLNLEFRFNFLRDGRYEEAAYMGSRQVMNAAGTYRVSAAHKRDDPGVTSLLSFMPAHCQFASEGLADLVKFFPIPNERGAQYFIGISPAAGSGQMTLEEASRGGDSWGLMAVH